MLICASSSLFSDYINPWWKNKKMHKHIAHIFLPYFFTNIFSIKLGQHNLNYIKTMTIQIFTRLIPIMFMFMFMFTYLTF